MGCGNSTEEKREDKVEDLRAEYTFGKTLGKGASCRVIEAVKKDDQSKVAIKMMSKEKDLSEKLYLHEVEILSKLNHQGIVKILANKEDVENFYVLTSLLEGGELFDRIVSDKYVVTEKIAASLVKQMLEALEACHKKNIVHRDLKPENFVFTSKKEDADIVLIDFGCAKVVEDEKEYKDLVGTVYYLAPELASAQKSGIRRTGQVLKSSDIWSMGVIAFVMLTGRPPFNGKANKDIFTHIVRDKLEFPNDISLSDGFKDFVSKALTKNPSKRITLEAALRHPWIQGKDTAEMTLNSDVVRYLTQFNYQSKLKTEITRCLAANMSSDPEKEVRKHFERLDKDGDGFLTATELEFLLLDMGFAPIKAKEEAVLVLKSADKNGDGQIDFDEFKAVWHRKLLSQHDKYIHKVFSVFDDNGDGEIDANELQSVLGNDATIINKMIAEVDENHDGKISFAEFQKAMIEDIEKGNFKTNELSPGAGGFNEEDLVAED